MSNRIRYIIALGVIAAITGFMVLSFYSAEDREDQNLLTALSSPLESASDLDGLVESAGGAKYVLLGESSHGTSEYYELRVEITQRLIAEKDFSFIAVEGDWPNIYHVNRYVKGYSSAPSDAREALFASNRWPDWMWANKEFLVLVEWLRTYNENLPLEKRIGLYGVDMQDLTGSLEAALAGLGELNTDLANRIQEKYSCLQGYGEDILIGYAQAYAYEGLNCENEVSAAVTKVLQEYTLEEFLSSPELFDIKQNMLSVKYGERYARELVAAEGPYSWNTRVQFMKETVGSLSEWYGEDAKGIIWAHNTHVGDARATEMSYSGMVNIGQLLREKHGAKEIYIVGFGTNRGTVIASRSWGGEREIINVPPATSGSIEDVLLDLNMPAFVLIFDQEDVPELLAERLGHRAKGVVYIPEDEQFNYVPTVLPSRYNAFIFLEETTPLNPLNPLD